ncbi:MAG: DUF1127 domain-containing protein [Rhodospirillaceae bacterium]|nr:DUF1127 domain-containing protein [Rhodospirillaceae bacterium]
MSLISSVLTWIQRARLRSYLMQRSDSVLADIGVSRALLLEGVRAYPWKVPPEPDMRPAPVAAESLTEADYAAAVAELETYADEELWDLGLTRGSIAEAVRHGRPGFPEDQRRAA